MNVTAEFLENWSACQSGVEYWKTLNLTDPVEIVRACIRDEKFSHARWLVARVLDRPGRIAWAIYSAEQVIEIYEKRYSDSKAPRNAIEAAKAVLANDNPESRKAARVAADDAAAYAAAAAAYAAAYAAADAADDAAAYAAADAADDAAAYAAAAAAYAAYAAYAAAAAAAAAAYADAAYAAGAAAGAAAAYAAAYAAADAADDADAARREMRIRIFEHGITLLEKAVTHA